MTEPAPISRAKPDEVLLSDIITRLRESSPDADLSCVDLALSTLRARAEQQTQAGATAAPHTVVSSTLGAARRLAKMKLGVDAVTAAILTPLVSNFGGKATDFSESFSPDLIELLEGVERLTTIRWDAVERESVEALRRMFMAMAQDVRVVLIVLAQRVELMRRASASERSVPFAQETLDVFAPLANRLGIWQFKWELEDAALRILQPDVYQHLRSHLDASQKARQALIDGFIAALQEKLAAEGIRAAIKGRPKHLYSIYNKMRRKQVSFDRIHDINAVRVLVDSVQECYAVLGVVHSSWVPVQKEFDDYIAMPKGNGYQSLHTVVIGPEGRPVEVQIRTRAMHQSAELGVAAHWAYKEGAYKEGAYKEGAYGKHGSQKHSSQKANTTKGAAAKASERPRGIEQDRFTLLRNLIDWEREITDPKQMVESLKTDIFKDQVYVFTPKGKIIDLPAGATPLDFAYRVHTMVGHRCRGARVNDQIVSLDHALKTGDRVEVLTRKEPQPSRDWLNPESGFLQTTSARQKVRLWFREQGRERAVHDGKEIITRELARLRLERADLDAIATRLRYASVEELQAAVGYGERSSQSVGSTALQLERETSNDEQEALPPSVPPQRLATRSLGVSLDDVDDVLGKRARCCNPVPGDDVVGFITRGRGVMIHRRDCAQLQDSPEPERVVDLSWGGNIERHTVFVDVHASECPGLMGDLAHALAAVGVDVSSAKTTRTKAGDLRLQLGLECRTAEQLTHAFDRLEKHSAVVAVHRRG